MKKLTFAMENYLETVYELSAGNSGVRLTDIAARMNVTKASANNAMAVLSEKGLIANEKYQEIKLTSLGVNMAKLIAEKHHIIQRFFTEVLHIDPAIADSDACAIEHVISNESVNAMERFLATMRSE